MLTIAAAGAAATGALLIPIGVEPGAPVTLELEHVVDGRPLHLGSAFGVGQGDSIAIDQLRYYVSNVRLQHANAGWFANPQRHDSSAGYFLVDASDPGSEHLRLASVPSGAYEKVEFLIGVDPARNAGGAQDGTLDPANGMFWSWDTGYIFFLLEGRSPQSRAPEHALTYHVGGGNQLHLARTVRIELPEPIAVADGRPQTVHVTVDLARLFDGIHRIHPADVSSSMTSPARTEVADNLPGLFCVKREVVPTTLASRH